MQRRHGVSGHSPALPAAGAGAKAVERSTSSTTQPHRVVVVAEDKDKGKARADEAEADKNEAGESHRPSALLTETVLPAVKVFVGGGSD